MDSTLTPLEAVPHSTVLTDPDLACAARADACVLIIGRPNAALAIASSIHRRSARASGPFTVLDCHESSSALAERLTRALSAGAASTPGTVLLQEIGEMSPAEQERLADELMHLRLGSGTSGPRVIASSSTPLRDRVEAGVFSDRLFYRLNTISVLSGEVGV